jgi:predicted Zn-dependent peptidase
MLLRMARRSMTETPALRYQKTEQAFASAEDAPFRVSGPLPNASASPIPLVIHSSMLENGLRLVVVERHAFPMVAARLTIGIASATTDDVGGRRAYLLGGTFLSPLERVAWTSGGCGVDSCFVASRGPSEELGPVLDRIAELISGSHTAPAAYRERLYVFKRQFDLAESALMRNLKAQLFGSRHRYGGPSPEDVPTLAELERLRAEVFVPSAATLVVVGDTTDEAVQREARQKFATWSGVDARSGSDARRPATPAGPSPLPDVPRIVFCRNRSIEQVWGTVGARGPGRGSLDAPAFAVLAALVGGTMDSTLYHHVREDLGVAYTIGARVDWYRDLSVLSLTGSFEGDNVITGVRGLLAAIDAVRAANPPADAVERAKAATIAADFFGRPLPPHARCRRRCVGVLRLTRAGV